jgi:hypothetical protein
VAFDDDHAVANAGLLLPATLAERVEIEVVVDQLVDLGARPGHHRPGRKVLTLVHALVAGGDCIDDADVLRAGSTAEVLGHRVMAPSTLGTFLRSFTFGHLRQLDRVAETVMGRAWAAGAGPGDSPMTIDVDSTICEVHGHHKGGAAYGYTRQLDYHPLLATRADTGEVLHPHAQGLGQQRPRGRAARQRDGRAGAGGPLTLRADSGFWSAKVLAACRRHHIRFSITIQQTKTVTAAIASLPEQAWTEIDYPDGGIAQVAETTLAGDRLIVRRTRLTGPQATLGRTGATTPSSPTAKAARSTWTPTTAATPSGSWPSATSKTAPGCATALEQLPGQRRLAGAGHPGPQPAALGRHRRARHPRPGRGQDHPTTAAGDARPAHPLGPPASAAPAQRLAMGQAVPRRLGAPASRPAARLTLQRHQHPSQAGRPRTSLPGAAYQPICGRFSTLPASHSRRSTANRHAAGRSSPKTAQQSAPASLNQGHTADPG